MTENTPLHTHDCTCCIFLGRYENKNFAEELDLYYCPSQSLTPTVIARYSSEPSEYLSNLLFPRYYLEDFRKANPDNTDDSVTILRSAKESPSSPLFEAAARSIEKNLIDENLSSASTARFRPK